MVPAAARGLPLALDRVLGEGFAGAADAAVRPRFFAAGVAIGSLTAVRATGRSHDTRVAGLFRPAPLVPPVFVAVAPGRRFPVPADSSLTLCLIRPKMQRT